MSDKQSKNIIKAILTVLLAVLIGEGVFGLGFFWPFLLILLDSRWVYWLAFGVGILISVIYRMPIGLPSLFLVTVTGGLSLLFSSRKESSLVLLVVSILANLVFNMAFGLSWNLLELFSVVLAWLVAEAWFERGESIKINY